MTKPKHKTKALFSINPIVSVALITGIFGLIGAVIALFDNQSILNRFFPSPTGTPMATSIPFARIQSLNVVQDGNIIDTRNAGETIVLTTDSNVVFQVNIITKTNLDDLVFHWEFCHTEINTNTIGQGAVEIPYKLIKKGADCIKVKIERGGQYLDTANFPIRID